MAKQWRAQIRRTKIWSSISLCQSRSKYARREEKQSEENRGQQLQSYFALLELFPKSIFYIMYTISNIRKSRIQRFKRCTNWSLNEEDMALARQLHPAHFHPGRNSIRLPPFPSGCITSGIRLPPLTSGATSTPRWHPKFRIRMGKEAFQLHPADISGWERRRFHFLDQPCPNPPWRLPQSLQAEGRMLHSCSVLLKLPDICDRHFEIFWDILL